jgi:hypothetical protein
MSPLSILKTTKGKFAKVAYTNAKGVTKTYQVRTGVHKHLHGGEKPICLDGITVFSVTNGNKGYKTFKAEGIQSINCGKISWSK